MDYIISFTPAQLVAWVLAICGGVVAITQAANAMGTWYKKAKKPETDQNARILKLEERMGKVENYLTSDHKHLDALDRGNRVTQQALLALLGHAIDGNNTKQLTDARDELHTYLVEK